YSNQVTTTHPDLHTFPTRRSSDLAIIAKRYPEAAAAFAEEIQPNSGATLTSLAKVHKANTAYVKKIRPPADRQAEIYIWFRRELDRKSTRLNSSHEWISYAVFCLK